MNTTTTTAVPPVSQLHAALEHSTAIPAEMVRAAAYELARPLTVHSFNPANVIRNASRITPFLAEGAADPADFRQRVWALQQVLSDLSGGLAEDDLADRVHRARTVYRYTRNDHRA